MNLIEKLAGYSECERLRKVPAASSFRIRGIEFTREELERAMLEYRRANNIFEVGDAIITNDDASNGKVYIIERNSNDVHFKLRSSEGVRFCGRWRIERHATDEEIRAGKRL